MVPMARILDCCTHRIRASSLNSDMVGIGAVSGGHFMESASVHCVTLREWQRPQDWQGFGKRALCRARGPRGIRLVSGRNAQESVIENSVNLQVAGKPPVSTSSTP